jgi:hypothetical protein
MCSVVSVRNIRTRIFYIKANISKQLKSFKFHNTGSTLIIFLSTAAVTEELWHPKPQFAGNKFRLFSAPKCVFVE